MDSIDEQLKAKLTNFLDGQKHHKHEHGYYNKRCAEAAKHIIDKVIETKQPYKVLAGESSLVTLRIQYYEGRRFLMDHMDSKEGYYRKICKDIKCRSELGYIEISFRPRVDFDTLPKATAKPWREDFLAFIESNPALGVKFQRDDILLSAEEIQWAKTIMADIDELFLYKFEERSLLVIRYNKNI